MTCIPSYSWQVPSPFILNFTHYDIRALCASWSSGFIKPRLLLLPPSPQWLIPMLCFGITWFFFEKSHPNDYFDCLTYSIFDHLRWSGFEYFLGLDKVTGLCKMVLDFLTCMCKLVDGSTGFEKLESRSWSLMFLHWRKILKSVSCFK